MGREITLFTRGKRDNFIYAGTEITLSTGEERYLYLRGKRDNFESFLRIKYNSQIMYIHRKELKSEKRERAEEEKSRK